MLYGKTRHFNIRQEALTMTDQAETYQYSDRRSAAEARLVGSPLGLAEELHADLLNVDFVHSCLARLAVEQNN